MKIVGVVGAMALSFAIGVVWTFFEIQDQHYNHRRVNAGTLAHYKVRIASSLRDGAIDEAIEELEEGAIMDLWSSSRNQWKHAPLDVSRWDKATIISWQEAQKYFALNPETIDRDRPTNFGDVRALFSQIPTLEREGLGRNFSEIYTGKEPPGLSIAKWSGAGTTLEALRGKVILLDFWHLECPGCLTRMPHMQELHNKYSERGLGVLSIHSAVIGNFEEVPEFLEKHQYDFSVGLDDGGKTEANYAVRAWPTYYMIDRLGHLAWGPSHDLPSDTIIQELLDKE